LDDLKKEKWTNSSTIEARRITIIIVANEE